MQAACCWRIELPLLDLVHEFHLGDDPPGVGKLLETEHRLQCRMARLPAIERNRSRLAMALQRFAEEDPGRCHVACSAEVRFHGAAALIHRTIQLHPLSTDLNVRLVGAPRSADRPFEHTASLNKVFAVSNDPAQNRTGCDGDIELTHDCRQIAVAELETQLPPHA